jgi:radical SAM protein with 4Fe4S-binding SPASM domain
VIHNLEEIIRRRNARGLKYPTIEWQFIVMKQNEHQIDEAEELSKKLGVDIMRFIPVGMPYDTPDRSAARDRWFPVTVEGRAYSPDVEQQFGQANKPSPCFYLYRSMVVNPDGGVSPCCVVYKKESDFGQLPVDDVMDLWNNKHYQFARSQFSKQDAEHQIETICDDCDIFAKVDKPWLKRAKPKEVSAQGLVQIQTER